MSYRLFNVNLSDRFAHSDIDGGGDFLDVKWSLNVPISKITDGYIYKYILRVNRRIARRCSPFKRTIVHIRGNKHIYIRNKEVGWN